MADLIASSSPFLEPLDYDNLSSDEQAFVDALITAGSAWIEKYCNRVFAAADYTDEVLDGNGWDSIFIDNPPINSLTDIDITCYNFDGGETTTTYLGTKFLFHAKSGEIKFKPATFISSPTIFVEGFQNIKITYNGGYAAVPDVIQMLCAEFVMQMFDPSILSDLLERERIGDYSYTRAKEYFDKVSFSKRQMLNSYKLRKV
jgi:hypothetical protein